MVFDCASLNFMVLMLFTTTVGANKLDEVFASDV